ncbi:hypothetical protein J31TS3_16590 [Paenibacillus lactis]|jgi:hypothetical protein|nr:hypothetical protein J31TS3_16590 [Paenibacillus lactis]
MILRHSSTRTLEPANNPTTEFVMPAEEKTCGYRIETSHMMHVLEAYSGGDYRFLKNAGNL